MAFTDFDTKSILEEIEKSEASLPKNEPTPEDRRQTVMAGSPAQRSEFVRTVSIEVEGYRLAQRFLEDLLSETRYTSKPGGLWVVGDGGCGKTFILESFRAKHRAINTTREQQFEVLDMTFPARPSESDILLKILLLLGQSPHTLRYPDNKTLRHIAIEAIKHCGVKMMMFDEAQHLWLTTTKRIEDRYGGPVGDFLKSFYEDTGIAYVFAGTPGLKDPIERDTQINTRWSGTVYLEAFRNDHVFRGILGALDQALPMQERSGLDAPDLSHQIFRATQGNFRKLKKLLARAVFLAAIEGARAIHGRHLAKAYFNLRCDVNTPFGKVEV